VASTSAVLLTPVYGVDQAWCPLMGALALRIARFAVARRSCFRPRVPDDARLETEARLFARYLVDSLPPPELIERYREANRVLFPEPGEPRDAAVIGFVHRHPWSVPFLDAAAALLRPSGLLRNKILLMGAILETSPAFADEFLPRNARPFELVFRLLVLGTAAVARAVLGAPLYAAASRSRA
jgi:hypothetical protein